MNYRFCNLIFSKPALFLAAAGLIFALAAGCQTGTGGAPAVSSSGTLTIKIPQNVSLSTVTYKIIIYQNSTVATSTEIASVAFGVTGETSVTLSNGTYEIVGFIDSNGDSTASNTEFYDRSGDVSIAGSSVTANLQPTTQKAIWGEYTVSGIAFGQSGYNNYIGIYTSDFSQNLAVSSEGGIVQTGLINRYSFKVKSGTYYVGSFADINANGVLGAGDYYGAFNWEGSGTFAASSCAVSASSLSGISFSNYLPSNIVNFISWDKTTIEASLGNLSFVGSTSLALDSSNYVYVSYYNEALSALNMANNRSGSWAKESIDANFAGKYSSLALDSTNKAFLSYYDNGNNDLEFATNENNAWEGSTVDAAGEVGIYSSLGLDSSKNVHISYYDQTNDDLKYATDAGGGWTLAALDSTGDVGLSTSLAVDSTGKIHISYYDNTNGDLEYANNILSGIWAITTIDFSGDVGSYTSLALDANNKAHIAYKDVTNGVLKYATNQSGSWVASTIDSTPEVGSFCSLALDNSGKAHVSYYDSTHKSLKYATNKYGFWANDTVDSYFTLRDIGLGSSIKVDSTGKIYISYYNATAPSGKVMIAIGQP